MTEKKMIRFITAEFCMRNSMKKENVKGSLQCLKAMASAEFQGKTNRGVASRISSLSCLKKIDNGVKHNR